jgi:ATP-dependent Clp protease protease subunit
MIHQPLGGARGQASDIQIQAEHILKLKKRLTKILAENCGQTVEKVAADCDRDYFMSADDAMKYGIIDKVFTKRA